MAKNEPVYYKLLNPDGTPRNGAVCQYSLPDDGKPGKWMPKIVHIELCMSGYHVVELEHLLEWRGLLLCVAEIRGESKSDGTKTVAQEIRLLRIVKEWNEKNLRLFAADCAERALPIFEKKYPKDDRPRLAIQAARAFAEGKISANAMLKARQNAYAAYAAAYAAYAAAAAAYAAADAAYAAAYAAADAAYAAADAAAAYADAKKPERQWQVAKLKEYLNID